MSFWQNKKVLVTGGASFIGSHLVERLLEGGARVRVADDLSSGNLQNLQTAISDVEFVEGDLKDRDFAAKVSDSREVVFHLAADHGGRGYIDLHQTACALNLALDQTVFFAGIQAGVEKLVFASSGCVYPNSLQSDPGTEVYLQEQMVGPPYDPDGMYGFAKLAGELTLKAIWKEHQVPSASCRYFTVYGPRCLENHAVMAMIARAYIKQDPFIVWGTGEQIRNWTHVSDIVSGTIAAAEKAEESIALNLGTMERVRVMDAARQVLELTGHSATVKTRPDMPTGPLNRVADNSLAKNLLGWEPAIEFSEGLRESVEWYFAEREREGDAPDLERLLLERPGRARG